MSTEFDSGVAQDLYHYALAMQGNQNSAFPCETLKHRLQASESAERAIWLLNAKHWQFWDEVMPRTDAMRTESDLCRVGEEIQAKVENWCDQNGVNANTGKAKGAA